MSPSRNFPAWAEPSHEGSEPSRAGALQLSSWNRADNISKNSKFLNYLFISSFSRIAAILVNWIQCHKKAQLTCRWIAENFPLPFFPLPPYILSTLALALATLFSSLYKKIYELTGKGHEPSRAEISSARASSARAHYYPLPNNWCNPF